MVIDVNTEGHIRAYARWDKEEYKNYHVMILSHCKKFWSRFYNIYS